MKKGNVKSAAKTEVLNYRVIKDLLDLDEPGKEPLLNSLANLFLTNFPRNLAIMKQAATSGELDLVRQKAHTMRSSGGNLGATGIVELCHKIEHLPEQTPRDYVQQLVDALFEEFEKVKQALSTYIK